MEWRRIRIRHVLLGFKTTRWAAGRKQGRICDVGEGLEAKDRTVGYKLKIRIKLIFFGSDLLVIFSFAH
jgi:hypothetical protein